MNNKTMKILCIVLAIIFSFSFVTNALASSTDNADNNTIVSEEISEVTTEETESPAVKTPDASGYVALPAEEPVSEPTEESEPINESEPSVEEPGEEKTTEPAVETVETGSTLLSCETEGYVVYLTADPGVLPEGCTLQATLVKDTDIIDTVSDAVEDVKTDADKNAKVCFDIKVLLNGEEVQPDTTKGNVKVSFSLKEQASGADVYHIDENVQAEKLAEQPTEQGADVTVTTDGFSYYVVEFYYGMNEFVLDGDGAVLLTDIMTAVGINGNPVSAVSSAPEYFSVEKVDGQFVVRALQEFKTNETLTVVTDEGVQYNINVLDAWAQEKTLKGKGHTLTRPDGSVGSYTSTELRLYNCDGADAYCVDCGVKVGGGYTAGSTLDANIGIIHNQNGYYPTSAYTAKKWFAYARLVAGLGWSDNDRALIAMGVWQSLNEAVPNASKYDDYARYSAIWSAFQAWLGTGDAKYYDCGTTVYVASNASNQRLCVFSPYQIPKEGYLSVKKVSSDPTATTDNPYYSFAGAKFIVKDSSGAQVAELIADANGNTSEIKLEKGTYTVEETAAPSGYQLNSTIYTINVEAEQHAVQEVADDPILGSLSVKKTSDTPGITNSNPCYSLAGAEFTVSGNGLTKKITTDASGNASLSNLPLGKYTITETKSSKGYWLNKTVKTVILTASTPVAATWNCIEPAGNDPAVFQIYKEDKETGLPISPGDGSLNGAQFTMKYYANTDGNTTGTPTRTWVFKTDYNPTGTTEGYAEYSDKYKVSGDALYYDKHGLATLPFGTYTVEETKAPEGYDINPTVQGPYIVKSETDGIAIKTLNGATIGGNIDVAEHEHYGKIKIIKTYQEWDQDKGELKPETYFEEGAEFQVYLTSKGSYDACDEIERDIIVTDADGQAITKDLPYGTYTVHQIKGMDDYAFAQDIQVKIEKDEVTLSRPLNNPKEHYYLRIQKMDASTGEKVLLAGCSFRVKDADGKYILQTVKEPTGTITYGTEENPYVTGADGIAQLPHALSPGIYKICEVKAPEGYVLTTEEKQIEITSQTLGIEDVIFTFADKPQMGRIEVNKVGKYYAYEEPQPEPVVSIIFTDENSEWVEKTVDLADAQFDIFAREDINAGGHIIAKAGDKVGSIVTDATGTGLSNKLYTGKYYIKETKAPAGYELDETEYEVDLTNDDQTVEVFTKALTVIDVAKEIDITTKLTDADGRKVTEPKDNTTLVDTITYENLVPGETYTVYTTLVDYKGEEIVDADGNKAETSRTFTPNTESGEFKTEITFNAEGFEDETVICYEAIELNGEIRALHEDLYDAEQTMTFLTPEIGTTAYGKTEDIKKIAVGEHAVINDKVHYKNIARDTEYQLVATLFNLTTGEYVLDADGNPVTSTVTFASGTMEGDVVVPIVLDTRELQGNEIVVYEELYTSENKVAEHKDNGDTNQIVVVKDPSIKTTASDNDGETKYIDCYTQTTVKDVVEYTDFEIGYEYTLVGMLYDTATGEPIKNNGKIVTKVQQFVPEEENGTVEMYIQCNTLDLAGKDITVAQYVRTQGETIIVHQDMEDADQTVTVKVPDIKTLAVNALDGTKVLSPYKKATIKDTVTYSNLAPGEDYVLVGVLVDAETGEYITESYEDNGETKETPIVQAKAFTSEGDGTAEVVFNFNAAELAGKSVVVYEKLFAGGKEIASHEDLTDKDQTVKFKKPSIKTVAEAKDGSKELTISSKSEVYDTIYYEDLDKGETYVVAGALIDRVTGMALRDKDGEIVVAGTKFTAQGDTGSVRIQFNFDSRSLAGRDMVIIEKLYRVTDDGTQEICQHVDLTDKDQTVNFLIPEIKTTASFDGTAKTANPSRTTTIIDKVEYKNLNVGTEYTLKGTLIDRATGEQVVSDGVPVSGLVKFTPTTKDGFVEITFTFNSLLLSGKSTVVFENLYDDDKLIATHSDLSDMDQTVGFNIVVKTGDEMSLGIYIAVIVAATAAIVIAVVCIRRKIRQH